MKRSLLIALAIFAVGCTTGGRSVGSVASAQWYCQPKVAYGDSLTANHPEWAVVGWPGQKPFTGTVTNGAVSGDSAAHQAGRALALTATCDTKPDHIYFLAGINDLVGGGASPDQVESYYTQLLGEVGVPVTFITIPPMPAGSPWLPWDAKRRQVNAWIVANTPDHADCESALAGPDGFLNPTFKADGVIHENNHGEQALAQCIGG